MHEHEKKEENFAKMAAEKLRGGVSSKKSGNNALRNLGIGLVIALIVVAIAAVGIVRLGVYKFGWEGPAVTMVAKALQYPAATVNGEAVDYAEFLSDVDTLSRFFANEAAQGAPADALPNESEIRQNALDRLVFETAIRQEATKRGVSVSDDEIETEYQRMIGDSEGGEAAVVSEIADIYGWTPEQFKRKVISSFLIQQKLGAALLEAPEFVNSAEKEAMDVLARLDAGEDWDTLALQHSDDQSTASNGGSLGAFGKGIMVPEFEAAAFALEPGETSGLVKTSYGFHIIRVDNVFEDDDGEVSSVEARHILIMPVIVDQYLTQLATDADVEVLIKI